ncbi:MAG: FG-GAP repeat protein, partial [Alphaproteobacteria bacterium]|nr:FG-GAP repeat protein [Alphaproteobacteria bacterium]
DTWLGSSVAFVGDVNGDGYDDVVASAPNTDVPFLEGGAAYLYLGSANGPSTVAAWSIAGTADGQRLGTVAGAGDVDGDGYDDVLIGVPAATGTAASEGVALLFRGGAGGLAAAPSWQVWGGVENASLGRSLAGAGDVNGDGYDDVLVHSIPNGNSAGTLSLYYGSAQGLGTVAAWTAVGTSNGEWFGEVMDAAGDLDGDGFGDFVVGTASGNGSLGAAHVYFGSAAGPSVATTLSGDQLGAGFGASVAGIGDVDGDGFDDLAIGAPDQDGGRGALVVHRGTAAGVSATPAWRLSPDGQTFAERVAGVGDVDGDGFDDLVVTGAAGQNAEVHLGSALGPLSLPVVIVQSDQNRSNLQVAGGGDANGDGVDDVLVAAPRYDGTEVDGGRVLLYAGRFLLDGDGDGVPDVNDVCPTVADPEQVDTDGDRVGDRCDRPLLDLAGTVISGGDADLVASGVGVGEQVVFWAAVGSGGAGPCPASLGGLCLDLGPSGVALGSAIADGNGVATLTATVPGLVVADGRYVVQASVRRGPGGARSVTSEVLDVYEHLDWDGDGLLDAVEGAIGTDPALTDTDGDGLSDLLELDPHLDPTSPDADGDGVDDGADLCLAGDDALDTDGDGVPDACDLCPLDADPGQVDADADGLGDACEGAPLALAAVLGSPVRGTSFGTAARSAGDVNGDGYDDVIIGAPGFDTGAAVGAVGVSLGGPGGLAPAPVWLTVGNTALGQVGNTVAGAGDVNGDGYDDVLIGVATSEGLVRLHLGSSAGPISPAAWQVQGTSPGDACGYNLMNATDVDGDGYDDVLVGCAGRVDLYLGGPAGPGPSPAWTTTTDADQLATGDLDGDGYDDVILGESRWDDTSGVPTRQDAGRVLVFSGAPGGPGAQPTWVIRGLVASDRLGRGVAVADVNGDGYQDLLASFGIDQVAEGGVRIWHGSPVGPWGAPTVLAADIPGTNFGAGLANAGDVDGDGYDDVLVGATTYSHPELREGGAYLFLGSATGVAASAAWLGESDQAGGSSTPRYGSVVSAAGDVDGDGLSDVLVAAPDYDADGPGGAWDFDGRVWLYRGRTP